MIGTTEPTRAGRPDSARGSMVEGAVGEATAGWRFVDGTWPCCWLGPARVCGCRGGVALCGRNWALLLRGTGQRVWVSGRGGALWTKLGPVVGWDRPESVGVGAGGALWTKLGSLVASDRPESLTESGRGTGCGLVQVPVPAEEVEQLVGSPGGVDRSDQAGWVMGH